MTIEFENRSADTRSGFKHVTRVYIDGQFEIENTAYYLNRTWESYRYQSVMKQAIYNLIEREKKRLKEEYKASNGKKRVSKDMVFTSEVIEILTNKLNEL
jgi:hypothetical protein